MKLSNLFLVTAVILVLVGLASVFLTDQVSQLYGPAPDANAVALMRFIGLTQFALGVMAFLVRETRDRTLVLAFGLVSLLQGLWFLLHTLNGSLNSAGWISVILYVLLTLGFGYFYFLRPVGSRAA